MTVPIVRQRFTFNLRTRSTPRACDFDFCTPAAIFDCLPALELSKLSLMTTVKGVLPVGAGDERVGDFNLTGDVGRTS